MQAPLKERSSSQALNPKPQTQHPWDAGGEKESTRFPLKDHRGDDSFAGCGSSRNRETKYTSQHIITFSKVSKKIGPLIFGNPVDVRHCCCGSEGDLV